MSEPIDEAKAATTQTNKQPKNLQEPDRETKAVQEEAGYTWLWVKQAIIQEVIGRYKLEKGGRIDIIEMISLLEHAFLQTQQDSRNEGTEWFSQFVSQVFQELDKRYVNSVETTLSMGGVEERETPEPALPQPQQQGGERTSE